MKKTGFWMAVAVVAVAVLVAGPVLAGPRGDRRGPGIDRDKPQNPEDRPVWMRHWAGRPGWSPGAGRFGLPRSDRPERREDRDTDKPEKPGKPADHDRPRRPDHRGGPQMRLDRPITPHPQARWPKSPQQRFGRSSGPGRFYGWARPQGPGRGEPGQMRRGRGPGQARQKGCAPGRGRRMLQRRGRQPWFAGKKGHPGACFRTGTGLRTAMRGRWQRLGAGKGFAGRFGTGAFRGRRPGFGREPGSNRRPQIGPWRGPQGRGLLPEAARWKIIEALKKKGWTPGRGRP